MDFRFSSKHLQCLELELGPVEEFSDPDLHTEVALDFKLADFKSLTELQLNVF